MARQTMPRLTVAIADATTSLGLELIRCLFPYFRVVGLCRDAQYIRQVLPEFNKVHWKSVDLFSLWSVEKALVKVDIAIYCVHSMLPAAHLAQGTAADFDILIADNFARAAQINDISTVINILSPTNTASSADILDTFGSYGLNVINIYPDITADADSVHLPALELLRERLPRLLYPRWQEATTKIIDISRTATRVMSALSDNDHIKRPDANDANELKILPVDRQPRALTRAQIKAQNQRVVCSVQRVPLPSGWGGETLAKAYSQWLPRFFVSFLTVDIINESNTEHLAFRLRLCRKPLLELTYSPERSSDNRNLFYISGGTLADITKSLRGRLEFRAFAQQGFAIAAIHDFTPRLPWWLYKFTQALIHLWVMRSFARWLKRQTGHGNKL